MRHRSTAVLTLMLTGICIIALGVYFAAIGLDKANKMSGILGLFAAILGLGMSCISLRLGTEKRSRELLSPGQTVCDTTIGKDVVQIARVGGNVWTSDTPSAPRA